MRRCLLCIDSWNDWMAALRAAGDDLRSACLHSNFHAIRDSLSTLLPFRSPPHFLPCVFFSPLTWFLIHLQAESLL